ncbi:MAG TPA: hypothetical protein VMV18_14810 [bacterium]|nr:hypothetical protein [bacterium]
MVKRKGLFVAFLIASAAIVAACTAKTSSGDNATGSLTPTPTASSSGTPTPAASPDVTPIESWITPGGTELWVKVQAVGNLTVKNIATYATTCSSGLLGISQVMTNGQTHIFRFDTGKNNSTMICNTASHTFVVDWKDADGACDPCVSDTKKFALPASATFPVGPGILQNISAYVAYTSTAIRFTATNANGPEVVIHEWRLYGPGGLAQPDCTFGPETIGQSAEPALFDTCKMDTAVFSALVPGTDYELFLYGAVDGAEYYEYGPMLFTLAP